MTFVQPEDGITGPNLCLQLGITYRQLDYWCRSGWLGERHRVLGTGNVRRLTPDEVEMCKTFVLASKVHNLGIQELASGMRATRDLFAIGDAS